MKLRLTAGDELRAVLAIDADPDKLVIVRCPDAVPIAREIARAVNRDYLFTALVTALTPFKSDEMGDLLISAMFTIEGGGDANSVEAEKRLRQLISAVDVILNGVALAESRDG